MNHASQSPTHAPRHDDGDGYEQLVQFVANRDHDAFAELMQRFGPMVFGVCQRVLGDRHDAEDAFQATFLVLAREAETVLAKNRPVRVWLYGIAYRMASRARRADARRKRRELQQDPPMPPADPTHEVVHRDLCQALDRELVCLPDRLREPLVLCYLGEQTHDEAARQLGVHPRSLERRLKAALSALQQRLGKRGVVLSVAALALLLTQQTTANVPSALATATTQVAVGAAPASASAAALTSASGFTGWMMWSAVAAAIVAVGGLTLGLNGGWSAGHGGDVGDRGVEVTAAAPVGPNPAGPNLVGPNLVGPNPADPNQVKRQWVRAHGWVVDSNDRPAAGATVVILARPMHRAADGTATPILDPLAITQFQTEKFRRLARGTTDAVGRFDVSSELTIPDPTTGAIWFHTKSVVVIDPDRDLNFSRSKLEAGDLPQLPDRDIR